MMDIKNFPETSDKVEIDVKNLSSEQDGTVRLAGGNILQKISSYLFGEAKKKHAYRNRQNMLKLVWNSWIEGGLRNSLHNKVRIEPAMKTKPDTLKHPWNILYREKRALASYPAVKQPIMLELFDRANGSLLILGEPGSGKTTMLLELCRQAIKRAKEDLLQPIPVVFNLSSWKPEPEKKPEQAFSEWLINELRDKYSVPEKIGRPWVDNDALLLLMDDLDEVPDESREACIQAINTFREGHNVELVICSRQREYRMLVTCLRLQQAVIIKPMTERQVNMYLRTVGNQFISPYKSLVQQTEQMDCTQGEREFLHTPLFLNLLALAYQNALAVKLEALTMASNYRKFLFDAYIAQMLTHRRDGRYYTREKTLIQLSWLAQTMRDHKQMIFKVEDIQPSWLPLSVNKLIFFLRLIDGLIDALIGGLIGGLIGALISGLIGGLIGALIGGLSFGLIEGLSNIPFNDQSSPEDGIKTSENFLVRGLNEDLIGWINEGLSGINVKERIRPGDGIKTYLNGSLLCGLIGMLIFELIGILIGKLSIMTVFGLLCGLIGWLDYGGKFLVKPFLSRWFLYRSGCLPWNINDFLDHCANCNFLRRVGSGYIFVHHLLMEHFAAMWEGKYAKEKV